MNCVELFTGCGGLALGLSMAGFKPQRMSEWDRHSVVNILHNRSREIAHVSGWPIHEEDVRTVDWSSYQGIDMVAGGPPCQPFSIGGRHRGHEDERDMWPEAVLVVREARPAGFLFENVRGLAREAFADYLRWVMLSLSCPDIERRPNEDRHAHLARLQAVTTEEAAYRVAVHRVNAADYGAAQNRHRVIVLGLRADVRAPLPALMPTHSRERLLWDQWVTGEYWSRHNMSAPKAGVSRADAGAARRLLEAKMPPAGLPWRTVRDAIQGLNEPSLRPTIPNHVLQAGARAYPGHTGSVLDRPAKALKAGVHGVPGGENMVALSDGSVRYFSVREAARLQGLPDDYEFVGTWSENMRQCGNAVPVPLAEAVGREMFEAVRGARKRAPRLKAA
ncbi:DNA (cytosine-5-)-methyltransferase [Mesorhizobium loti]|uniref:Cytosine-specific methyltransferase n=2 Tax=Rhizobium loti TaxID=381 RepID=A0A6M7U7G3_RHILI|nr:DNA (cytosine-5-)-methyltransferase [Mesorhizobium loti]QKC73579.1 DNA (cytosine-5-)-methyltransferase [Mesorhizobium loti]